MNKEKKMQYFALACLILFVLEIFIVGIGNRNSNLSDQTPTPLPVQTFTGVGMAPSVVKSVTNQYYAECNTTDLTLSGKIANISGVTSAAFDQQGVIFSISKDRLNDSDAISSEAQRLFEAGCEDGFSFYRAAYVMPLGNLQLFSTTGNQTRSVSNYSLLSFAQALSMPGITAFVYYPLAPGAVANMTYAVQFANSVPQRATAKEDLSFIPKVSFAGESIIKATIIATAQRLLILCKTNSSEQDASNIASLKALPGVLNTSAEQGMYIVDFNKSVANPGQLANRSGAAIIGCDGGPRISKVGFVQPTNGSDWCSSTNSTQFAETKQTEFNSLTGCKNFTFNAMMMHSVASGQFGIPALLNPATEENSTIEATLSLTSLGSSITNVVAAEDAK